MNNKFDFNTRFNKAKLNEFSELVKAIQKKIPFKVSARGWCYLIDQEGYINKDHFNKVESAINKCRKQGILPVDFIAEEKAREFMGVEIPSDKSYEDIMIWMLNDVIEGHTYKLPDWWEGEDYYIQVVVEKIDLMTLFAPVCREYHIPIANSKGWSSILQRAEYCKRFKEAESLGLQCVLLYCGDHDPDGVRISDTLRKNLEQVQEIYWDDGTDGYDPENLIIERFGLNLDFIKDNNITWIDNLITGSGKNLGSPMHPNHKLPYVQNYLNKVGYQTISIGGYHSTIVDVRLIFAAALKCAACSLIICHNHPSGNTRESKEDLALTAKVKEAGKLLDIELVDHIILTEEDFTSFANEGIL